MEIRTTSCHAGVPGGRRWCWAAGNSRERGFSDQATPSETIRHAKRAQAKHAELGGHLGVGDGVGLQPDQGNDSDLTGTSAEAWTMRKDAHRSQHVKLTQTYLGVGDGVGLQAGKELSASRDGEDCRAALAWHTQSRRIDKHVPVRITPGSWRWGHRHIDNLFDWRPRNRHRHRHIDDLATTIEGCEHRCPVTGLRSCVESTVWTQVTHLCFVLRWQLWLVRLVGEWLGVVPQETAVVDGGTCRKQLLCCLIQLSSGISFDFECAPMRYPGVIRSVMPARAPKHGSTDWLSDNSGTTSAGTRRGKQHRHNSKS